MILMMGIAGSGKGTQSKLLSENNGFELLTMGDVLRQNATDAQRQKMEAGILLGDDEIIEVVDKALSKLGDSSEVILDGYPRTLPQAEWLIKQIKNNRFKIKAAIHLTASKEAVRERLIDRARTDDVDGAIEKRFAEYEKSTSPIIDWLRQQNVTVFDINGERPVEIVHQDILSRLNAA